MFYNATIFTKNLTMMTTKTVTFTACVDLVTADQSHWIESALMQFSPVLKITWHTVLTLPLSLKYAKMWHLGLKSTLSLFSGLRFGFLKIRSQSKGLIEHWQKEASPACVDLVTPRIRVTGSTADARVTCFADQSDHHHIWLSSYLSTMANSC